METVMEIKIIPLACVISPKKISLMILRKIITGQSQEALHNTFSSPIKT
jgi:hypothetical protein